MQRQRSTITPNQKHHQMKPDLQNRVLKPLILVILLSSLSFLTFLSLQTSPKTTIPDPLLSNLKISLLLSYLKISSEANIWKKCRLPYYPPPRPTNTFRRLVCSAATKQLAKQVEMDSPKEIFLKDYKQPDYFFETVDLNFTLGEKKTFVHSKIAVYPRIEDSSPLVLDGVDLKLISLKVNGKDLKVEPPLADEPKHLLVPDEV